MIGAFGDKIFEVSAEAVRSFQGFSRSLEMKIATHEIIHNKPAVEVLNMNAENISFTVQLFDRMNVNVRDEIESWNDMVKSGKAHYFTIAGIPIGSGYFLLTNIDPSYGKIDSRGYMESATLSISAIEYVIYDSKAKETPQKQNVTKKEVAT